MASSSIVEAFDEFEDRMSRLSLRLEAAPIEQLAFEGGEETLAHGVVVGVADRAHRGAHAGIAAAATELDRGILGGIQLIVATRSLLAYRATPETDPAASQFSTMLVAQPEQA